MARDDSILPTPSPEHRRIAAGQFERANQVIATGNYDYGIRLLLSCCKLDPANLIYRQALRRTQKLRFNNNLRGSWFAWLTAAPAKARIKRAMRGRDYLAVLALGEQVLTRNPWDVGAQMDMARAAEVLGLLDLAVWTLEQARQKSPRDAAVNRALARLYEQRGNFTQAIALWELVRKVNPADTEATDKVKDLAANETIARGQYEAAVGGGSGRGHRSEGRDDGGSSTSTRLPRPDVAPKTPAPRDKTPVPEDRAEADFPHDQRARREAADLRARVEADPTNPNPYLQLTALYRRAGQLEKAREVLEKGLAPTGNQFELAAELTDLEIEPFRQNLAITEQRLRDNPDEELRKIRIRLLKEINARELELYRQKADRYPTDMTHRFEMGVRLLRAGQYDEAIKQLQQARSDPRHHWRSLLYLGHCFKGRNNWRLARRNFEEALRHLPLNEDAARKELLFQLAQGCAESGELEDAVNFAHELANLDFGYRDIGALLDDWQARLGQRG